jgi:hypothetical protein
VFPSVPQTSLILLEGELWRQTSSQRWKKVLVVLTRDKFLHILSGREECADLMASFALKRTTVTEYTQMEELMVDFVEHKS